MSNSTKSSIDNLTESFFPKHHQCFRCRRFYNRCRCNRNMYKHYRQGCMCKMIIKVMIVVMIIGLIYYAMNMKEKKMQMPMFDNY